MKEHNTPQPPLTLRGGEELKIIKAAAAIITKGDLFLITKRMARSPMGHCWEFPGGKIEAGETVEECIVRECREEIDVTVKPLRRVKDLWYDYPHGRIHLYFVLCELVSGTLRAVECSDFRWIKVEEFPKFEFPPADVGVIEELMTNAFEAPAQSPASDPSS